jgi:hypothetical protein
MWLLANILRTRSCSLQLLKTDLLAMPDDDLVSKFKKRLAAAALRLATYLPNRYEKCDPVPYMAWHDTMHEVCQLLQ